ncbi:MAG: tetratricopeptide repeat protein [Verrucomicrobiota bacterium]
MATPEDTQQPEPDSPLAKAMGPSPVEKYVEDNKAGIILALAGIVALASAWILFSGLNSEKMLDAGNAYSEAETVDDLKKIQDQFPGTVVAGNSLLKQAELEEEDGDPDAAKATLLKFRDQFREHPRFDQALVVLGRMAEDAGNLTQAASFYNEVARESDLAPLAQIHLGDLAMQEGDYEKARNIYEPIQQDFPGNAWMGMWQQRINQVKRLVSDADTDTLTSDGAPEEETIEAAPPVEASDEVPEEEVEPEASVPADAPADTES